MSKTEKIIAYIMQQLNLIGENFGWQMGRIGANYENGYMKCSQDSKAHFRKEKVKKDIEQILSEEYFRESTKKIVTNADRIRNMSDEELTIFLEAIECNSQGWCEDCQTLKGNPCKGLQNVNNVKERLEWLKERVE